MGTLRIFASVQAWYLTTLSQHLGGRSRCIAMSSKTARSTEQDPGQQELLNKEILPQKREEAGGGRKGGKKEGRKEGNRKRKRERNLWFWLAKAWRWLTDTGTVQMKCLSGWNHGCWSARTVKLTRGQQVLSCYLFSKHPGSIPSTDNHWLTTICNSSSGGLEASAALYSIRHKSSAHTCRQNTCTYEINIKIKNVKAEISITDVKSSVSLEVPEVVF